MKTDVTTIEVADEPLAVAEPTPDDQPSPPAGRPSSSEKSRSRPPARPRGIRWTPRRRAVALLTTSALAVAGLAGTIGFGLAWNNLNSQNAGSAEARQAASRFLLALTNFNARTVDRDFASVTAAATGTFANQANQFFGSTIRQQLETAQASSQGQIRSLYLETYSGDRASVYAVVDQTYSNNKIKTPQSDVLRVVVDLSRLSGAWKVAQLTVLEGPQAAAAPSAGANG